MEKDMGQTEYDVFISYSRKDYVDDNLHVIPGNALYCLDLLFVLQKNSKDGRIGMARGTGTDITP